ncbi:hypothetical protein OG875_16615 [Streptomyces sp. NBC_01498]|uniref:hypothetical protein n=1 Tax=Streptomyces sp. NBC_01498 TaxID=2975870 RepID=UPI002E7ADA90|nr:hypothetical protein [Streptomyces sp. NBC_01498]WTL26069.1 hypothetical protein OG875_16615 [Streptomyces sp. NBC_01498]
MVQQHRRRRGVAVVAAAVTVAGVVTGTAGCSGSEGAAADDRPTGDPAAVLRSADSLVEAGSSKARTSLVMATGGTRVTIRGEGRYDFRKRMGHLSVVLPPDPAGADAHRPISELLAPAALYMKNRGAGVPDDKWVMLDSTTLADGNLVTGGATDPLTAAELLRAGKDVVLVGEEELAGVRVTHYRGVTDIGRAAKRAAPYAREALAAAARGFADDVVPFDVYLDDEGRLRKVRHQFSYRNQGRTVAVASTTLLYEFGVPVGVRLPPKDQIFTGKITV